jgi:hypothetical protein
MGYSRRPVGHQQDRGMVGMLSILASAPWLQFNLLSLMNVSKGVFGVNWGVRRCLTLRIQRVELLRLADPT